MLGDGEGGGGGVSEGLLRGVDASRPYRAKKEKKKRRK